MQTPSHKQCRLLHLCVDFRNDSRHSHHINLIDVNVKGDPEIMLAHCFLLVIFPLRCLSLSITHTNTHIMVTRIVKTIVSDPISQFNSWSNINHNKNNEICSIKRETIQYGYLKIWFNSIIFSVLESTGKWYSKLSETIKLKNPPKFIYINLTKVGDTLCTTAFFRPFKYLFIMLKWLTDINDTMIK